MVPFTGKYGAYQANTNPQAVYLREKEQEHKLKEGKKPWMFKKELVDINSSQNIG